MAHLQVIILTLFAAFTSSRGDVQEAAPYQPSGWQPSGPLFLLPSRSEVNTLSFSNTPLSPPPPPPVPSGNQFSSSSRPPPSLSPTASGQVRPNSFQPSGKLPVPRTFPFGGTIDEPAKNPTRQFSTNNVTYTQNTSSPSSERQFPDGRQNLFADINLSNYPGDQADRKAPSTKFSDNPNFRRNSQSLRPSQAYEQPDDFTQEYTPPSRDFIRQYLPPTNEQADPARSSYLDVPAEEGTGGLSQYSPSGLEDDDFQASPAQADSSFASDSDSSYRPIQEYGVPSPGFEPNTQQKTPRVYIVVLPVQPQQQAASEEQAPAFAFRENIVRTRVDNRNNQASQRREPRRRTA